MSYIDQADSFKAGPELLRNAESLERLLGMSGVDKTSMGRNTEARGEPETGGGLFIGKYPKGSSHGDRLHQILSPMNSCGTSLDILPR